MDWIMKKLFNISLIIPLFIIFTACDFTEPIESYNKFHSLKVYTDYTGPGIVSPDEPLCIEIYTTENDAKTADRTSFAAKKISEFETNTGLSKVKEFEMIHGDYYILVYWDADGSHDFSNGDHYEYYEDTNINNVLTPAVLRRKHNASVNLTFDDSYIK